MEEPAVKIYTTILGRLGIFARKCRSAERDKRECFWGMKVYKEAVLKKYKFGVRNINVIRNVVGNMRW